MLTDCKKFMPEKVRGSSAYIVKFSPYIWFPFFLIIILSSIFLASTALNNDYRLQDNTNLEIYMAMPDSIVIGEAETAYLTIVNNTDVASPRVYLRFPSDFMSELSYYNFLPRPEKLVFEQNGDLLVHYGVIKPYDMLMMEMNFIPLVNKDLRFRFEILSPISVIQVPVDEIISAR